MNFEQSREHQSEHMFEKEEILSLMREELAKRNLEFSYIEGEKSDEKGIYFLEVRARAADDSENMGMVFYRTTYKGAPYITLELLDNDPPINSEHIATYNNETGEWKAV